MMFNPGTSFFALVTLAQLGQAAHGDGAEGTVMGPAAFLWPDDGPWSAAYDNIGPCGSNSSVSNRTEFPLGSIGSIELTIADEVYNLAIRIAYSNNPTTQGDLQAIKNNVSEVEPGHQCYSMPMEPSTVVAGSNATIQLEYWADDSTKNESFFACADITFVEASAFTEQVLCFNVAASEFDSPSSTSTSSTVTGTAATQTTTSAASAGTNNGSGGLSGGAKAGIAVGCIVGAALIFAAVFFAIRWKRAGRKDAETIVAPMEEKNSVGNDRALMMSGKTVS